MSGDVVGTAFVRIKSLTSSLAKDIEKNVKKGMKDAKLDKIAEEEGEASGEAYGKKFGDYSSKVVKKKLKSTFADDSLFGDWNKALHEISESFDQLEFDFPERDEVFSDKFRRQLKEDSASIGIALKSLKILQRERGQALGVDTFDLPFQDLSLRRHLKADQDSLKVMMGTLRIYKRELGEKIDVPTFGLPFDEGRIGNFFRRFKSGLNDTNSETQNWAGRMRSHFLSLGNDIERGPLDRALDGLSAKLRNLGSGAGLPHIGRMGTMIGLLGGAVVAALPYIQDIGAAIIAYATGLVAQIGFLVTALGGLGVAAGAVIGSVALAAGPIALAFKAETELLTEFKDAMGAAGEEFMRIGVATQQTLLPALDEAVFTLGDLIPMFSEFGLFVGRSVGDFAKLAAGVLTGNEAQGRFQAILQSSLRILDMLLPTLLNVGDILSGLWVAAIPAAERFAASIQRLTGNWSDMIREGLRTGDLTATLNLWYDRAETFSRAFSNLFGGLFDTLRVGADSADDLFVRFDEWAENYRAFTESEAGQNRIALIFDNALAVMREVNAVAADLFDGIFGRLGEVGGVDSMVASLQRFRDVIPEIQEFWANAYDTIKEVVELFASTVWEKITRAWDQMAEPLGRLATQIMDLLAVMNESGAFDVFLNLMEILTNVLSTLLAIPGFGQFVAYFLAFGAAAKVATLVLGPFLKLFGGFSILLLNLIRAKAGLQLVGLAGSLGKLAAGFNAVAGAQGALTFSQAMQVGAGRAGSLAGAIGGATRALGFLGPVGLAAGAAIAVGGLAFFNAQKRSQEWRQEIRQATDALGLLNDGLNTTAEGVSKYINETSRFESRNQIDDLERLGFSVAALGEEVANGTLTYEEFANRTLSTGETYVLINNSIRDHTSSLQDLQKEYGLTDDELRKLAKGEEVFADGTILAINGNDDLIASFVELNKVIGAAAKDNIDKFVTNATNIELLGSDTLSRIKNEIKGLEDEDAGQYMVGVQEDLQAAALRSMGQFRHLSQATRDQAREQATLADGTFDAAAAYAILSAELKKQNVKIRESLDLFNSADFEAQFGAAKEAANIFNTVMADTDFSVFANLNPSEGLGVMLEEFPKVTAATDNLFRQLEQMPAAEFNAMATAIGVDADTLRGAVEGSTQAILNLQEQAIATLPSVGELLDDATSVDDEGKQVFDEKGFRSAIDERVRETGQFASNIKTIKERIGDDAARLAAQEGPEAAAALVEMIGHDAVGLTKALDAMELSEQALRNEIETVLGPGIRTQYAMEAGLTGDVWGQSAAAGLNSPSTLAALKDSSLATLDVLAKGFKGRFTISPAGILSFEHTGVFEKTTKRLTPGQKRLLTMASGGYVSAYGAFNKSFGSDTIPAMLTPGEFVNTRATVDRLGVGFFEALNKGSTPAVPVSGGNINANGWTIVAPSPEESARQMISRFRTASYLLGN